MVSEDSDTQRTENYTLTTELVAGEFDSSALAGAVNDLLGTDLSVGSQANPIVVEVEQTIDQRSVILTDETFFYDLAPEPEVASNLRQSLTDAAVTAAADVIARNQSNVSQRAAETFVQDRIEGQGPSGDDLGPLGVTVQTEGPGEYSETGAVSLPPVATVPLPEGVSEDAFIGALSNRSVPPVEMTFTTEPTNQGGDIIPEIGTQQASTTVEVPPEEFVTIERVSLDEFTGSLALDFREAEFPSTVNPRETFDLPVSLTNQGGAPATAVVTGPAGNEVLRREVPAPDSPTGSRSVDATLSGVEVPNPSEAISQAGSSGVADLTFELSSPDGNVLGKQETNTTSVGLPSPSFTLGEPSGIPSAINPSDGFQFSLPVTDEGGIGGEVRARVPGTDVFAVAEVPAEGTTDTTLTIPPSVATNRPESLDVVLESPGGSTTYAEESYPLTFVDPEPDGPNISLDPIQVGDVPSFGDPVPVDVPVSNAGSGLSEVTVRGPEGLSKDRPLDPGETRTFDFDIPQAAYGETVEFAVEQTISTPVGESTRTLATQEVQLPSVEPEGGTPFTLGDPLVGEPGDFGDPVPVEIPVGNGSPDAGDVTIEGPGSVSRTVTVPGDSTETATLNVPEDFYGTPARFSIPGTSESVEAQMPDVTAPEPVFAFADDGPTAPDGAPSPGEPIPVEVPIENRGDAPGDAVLEAPGGVTERRTVGPGEVVTVGASLPARLAGQRAEFSLTGDGDQDTASLRLPTQSISTPGQAVDVRVDSPSSGTIGEGYEIAATVENTSESQVTVNVTTENADKERTYDLQSGGESTFTDRRIHEDEGTYTHTFVVTVDGSGETLERTATTVARPLSPPDPGGTGVLGTDSTVAGNDSFSSRINLTANDASFDGEVTTVKANVENVALTGDGFQSPFEVVAEVGGTEVVGEEKDLFWDDNKDWTIQVEDYGPVEVSVRQPPRLGEPRMEPAVVQAPAPPRPKPRFIVEALEVPDVVDVGEEVPVSFDLSNTGGRTGDARLQAPGLDRSVSVSPDSTQTVEHTYTPDGSGVQQYALSVENVATGESQEYTQSVDVEAPSLLIERVGVPNEVGVGEQFTIEPVVANSGSSGTMAEVAADGQSSMLDLPPGESATAEFTTTLDSDDQQAYTVEVRDPQSGDVYDSTETTVRAADPRLSLDSVDVPDSATPGETVPIDVEVSNTGGSPADVAADIGSETRQATVGPGETRTLSADLTAPEGGDLTTRVSVVNAETDSTVGSRRLSVPIQSARFALGRIDAPDAAPVGEPVSVDIQVRNTGESPAVGEVEVGDSILQTDTLGPGESETVTYDTVLEGTDDTSLDVSVRNARTGETTDQRSATINTGTPQFSIRSFDVPTEAMAGESVTGEAVVANVGDIAGQVSLRTGLGSRNVSVSPGSERTVTLPVTKDPDDTQQVRVRAVNTSNGRTEGEAVDTIRLERPEETPTPEPDPSPPRRRPPRGGDDDEDERDFGDVVADIIDPLGLFES